MQKKEFKLESKEKTVKIIGDSSRPSFELVCFMPIAVQFVLANTYIDAYFNSAIENLEDMFLSEWDCIGAEHTLMLEVIDKLTSIPVSNEDGKSVINIDEIVEHGVWDLIKSSISNYNEFRTSLDIMVEDAKREILSKRSVGHVIDGLAEKALTFVSSLAEIDLSEEGMKRILDSVGSLSEKLADSPIGGLLDESKEHKNLNTETT